MFKKPLTQKILSFTCYLLMAMVVAWLITDRFKPTLKVGDFAPIKENFLSINGSKSSFKNLLQKPMMINFWASWCSSCMKEMPTLSKLSHKYRYEMVFLGVAVQSPHEDILKVKRSFLLDYDQVVISEQALDLWQARALPTSYIINTRGQILWAKAGVVDEAELEAEIKKALK